MRCIKTQIFNALRYKVTRLNDKGNILKTKSYDQTKISVTDKLVKKAKCTPIEFLRGILNVHQLDSSDVFWPAVEFHRQRIMSPFPPFVRDKFP